MKPSAPVTRTGTPASDRSAIATGPVELVALADVDPVVLDLERADPPASDQRVRDDLRHRLRLAGSDQPDDRGIEDVHPGVHLSLDRRLLGQPDDPVAFPLDAAERDDVK